MQKLTANEDTPLKRMGDSTRQATLELRNSTNDFLFFSKESDGDGVNVLVADENVWLTQNSLCSLYDVSKSTVSEHLKNIFDCGEREENSVVRKFRTTASDGKTYSYKKGGVLMLALTFPLSPRSVPKPVTVPP